MELGATPGSAQVLFLTLGSGVNPGHVLRTFFVAESLNLGQ